jgi:hypothetical protein
MKITYIFKRTHFDGTREEWRISGCTREEAAAFVKQQGWEPPRWWQWWRRGE